MSIDYNQQMSVYHAIYGRRTTWEFKDGLVNRSAVERMLDAAVCCAAQNISLAGAAEGLVVSWQTGGPCRNPKLKGVLGVDESWDLVTLLFIGAPVAGHSSRRTPVSKWVHWS